MCVVGTGTEVTDNWVALSVASDENESQGRAP